MKIKYFLILAAGLVILGGSINAAAPADIQYPVAELGNCASEVDCKAYCDKPGNLGACLDFAEKNNLMSEEEISTAKKFLAAAEDGPGGCNSKTTCDEYCSNTEHIDECISFAEKNNLIPPGDLQEAKKIQGAIKRGVKPPPCGNKKSCDAYCEDPDHMEECITFGMEAGFIQGKELEDAQKMLQAIKKGVKPPPCKGKEACDEYCSNPDNMEVCMNFAMEAGFMSEQEKADSQKMLQAIKKGAKPPPCKGKDECDAYCQQEGHMEECINFSVAAGFMSEKDAEMAKKTGGKGPGGCKGKEECEAFCNNQDNQETCFNFAKDNGMMPEGELKRMEEGKEQMKQTLQQMPQEVADCLASEVGAETVEKMKNGVMPPKETGDKMQGCFGKMGPPQQGPPCEGENCKYGPPPQGQMPPCEGENCKYGAPPPCEGENCKYGPPPQGQMPPCEGENCKYGPPQGQPCEGENCQNMQQIQPGRMMPGQPCEGENCKYGPPPQGQQPPVPGQPCEGPNCPQVQPMQPGQQQYNQSPQGDSGGRMTPPPGGETPQGFSSEPGGGGSMPPGERVPQMQPTQQQPMPSEPTPPPPPSPPPSPPPPPPSEPGPTSFLINPDSFVASAVRGLFNLLFNK